MDEKELTIKVNYLEKALDEHRATLNGNLNKFTDALNNLVDKNDTDHGKIYEVIGMRLPVWVTGAFTFGGTLIGGMAIFIITHL